MVVDGKSLELLSISLPFKFLGPIPWKFMVGAVGHFTLKPMAHTNHKVPSYGGPGLRSEVSIMWKIVGSILH